MKPYGNDRKDNLTCNYGCCTGKYKAPDGCRLDERAKRRSRKRARQESRELCSSDDGN